MTNRYSERTSNNFDFLRLFAAFCVMVSHSTEHLVIPFLWVSGGTRWWFYDGVPVFFVISGMLVYRSYEKCIENSRPITDFYRNRFLRIAPAIYAYIIATTVILLTIGAISFNVFSKSSFWGWVVSNLILVPVYFPDFMRHIGVGVLNGSLWTIPSEFSFYLVVPAIFLLEKKLGIKKTLTILTILGLFGSTVIWYFHLLGKEFEPLWFKLFKISLFSGLVYFALGIFWLKFWKRAPKSKYLFILSVIAYSLGAWVFQLSKYFGPTWDLVRAIPLSYAIVWFGYKGPKLFSKITAKIGDLSYGVYIWHMVVINVFLFLNLPIKLSWMPSSTFQLLVFAITFAIAKLSWTFIEKPCLAMKNFSSRLISEDRNAKTAA